MIMFSVEYNLVFFTLKWALYIYIYIRSGSAEYKNTPEFHIFMAALDSPTCLERDGEASGVQLDAISETYTLVI